MHSITALWPPRSATPARICSQRSSSFGSWACDLSSQVVIGKLTARTLCCGMHRSTRRLPQYMYQHIKAVCTLCMARALGVDSVTLYLPSYGAMWSGVEQSLRNSQNLTLRYHPATVLLFQQRRQPVDASRPPLDATSYGGIRSSLAHKQCQHCWEASHGGVPYERTASG